jgi:hypothetical protein
MYAFITRTTAIPTSFLCIIRAYANFNSALNQLRPRLGAAYRPSVPDPRRISSTKTEWQSITYILAGRAKDGALIVANSVPEKFWQRRGCAIASYSIDNSPNLDVPGFICSIGGSELCPGDLAQLLCDRLATLDDGQRGNFGLLVMGRSENGIELLCVQSKMPSAPILQDLPEGAFFDQNHGVRGEGVLTLDEMQARVHQDMRREAAKFPGSVQGCFVGARFEASLVRPVALDP